MRPAYQTYRIMALAKSRVNKPHRTKPSLTGRCPCQPWFTSGSSLLWWDAYPPWSTQTTRSKLRARSSPHILTSSEVSCHKMSYKKSSLLCTMLRARSTTLRTCFNRILPNRSLIRRSHLCKYQLLKVSNHPSIRALATKAKPTSTSSKGTSSQTIKTIWQFRRTRNK